MPSSDRFDNYGASRPSFYIGQHDSDRSEVLTDEKHRALLSLGFTFTTAPITNSHFRRRVFDLRERFEADVAGRGLTDAERNDALRAGPLVPTLTADDTSLFPGPCIASTVACCSPWIDLYAADPLVASLSRQVLNLEVAYASFCGVRSVIVPGPRADADAARVAQYGRAVQEALRVAPRILLAVHLPMYREPGLDETAETLSGPAAAEAMSDGNGANADIDLFSAWDTWHTVRTMCDYDARLFVAVRMPRRLPETELQTRWFAEPMHYLTFAAGIFQKNRAGYPTLSKHHQALVHKYMRLKNAPWLMLSDVGPEAEDLAAGDGDGGKGGDVNADSAESAGSAGSAGNAGNTGDTGNDFPSLAEARHADETAAADGARSKPAHNSYLAYLEHVEREQTPYSAIETSTLTSFQDWLQSPLQPLADNLESATYEVFEGDPVKYNQYEAAITAALADWKALNRPSSALPRPGRAAVPAGTPTVPELVVAVAGAGRGPLVTRVLRASHATGVPVQLWALEKNQNAFVYLQRMNRTVWGGRVHLVQTDMRAWSGPVAEGHEAAGTTTSVDVLVSELLGSFGDNELSPECIDGIQHRLARPHGISIPATYTAHLSPIAYPRVYAELSRRATGPGADAHAFATPWVTHLFAIDLVAQRVPGRPRFQQAWEFAHPTPAASTPTPTSTIGVGSMNLAAGRNEHNARHCHLTFVCRPRGVMHGLAGYFESVLYRPAPGGPAGDDPTPIEISTRPDQIDRKSKDMISWFPIFFPLKDAEIEVSMWRQTDDSRVWYEWMVEVFVWVGPDTRVKVAASELHSSHGVACLM